MRIAVLMSGQARYIEQSSWYWRNKIFPKTFERLHVDYFLNLWDDNSTGKLSDTVKNLYDAKVVDISDYNLGFHYHRHNVKLANKDTSNRDWHLCNTFVKNGVCYYGDEFTSYTYNFPGMFLATARMAETFEPYKDHYDIVIKTRTDCVMNPMAEQHWGNLFSNMLRNKVFEECIFAPWLRIRNGLPFFGDLCFIGKTDLMFNFMHKMDENLLKLSTEDKHLMSDYLVDTDLPFAHWLWSRLSMYTKTDWLALSVVWPTPFDCALIRNDEPIEDKSFNYLLQAYKTYEAGKHKSPFHLQV